MKVNIDGLDIEITPDNIRITVPVEHSHRALRFGNGSITHLSEQAFETWPRTSERTFGTESAKGESVVVVSMRDLRSLAYAAAFNRSKKSQQGPAYAIFQGVRQFKAEVKS